MDVMKDFTPTFTNPPFFYRLRNSKTITERIKYKIQTKNPSRPGRTHTMTFEDKTSRMSQSCR